MAEGRGGDDDLDDQREALYSADRARAQALKALEHDRRARLWGPAQPSGSEHPAGDATEYQAGLVQTLLEPESPELYQSKHYDSRWSSLQNCAKGK
jgi:hypothetical protein